MGFDAASNASSVVEERDVCIDEVTVDILKAPFNPCIEDADPDCSPPPKDGDPSLLGCISIAGLGTGISSKNRDRGLVVADPLCNNQSTSV